jgi:hypothetical protein
VCRTEPDAYLDFLSVLRCLGLVYGRIDAMVVDFPNSYQIFDYPRFRPPGVRRIDCQVDGDEGCSTVFECKNFGIAMEAMAGDWL